ncbi:hypothetical protein [Pseudarthrobacter sp. MM222]|uniref:hypothetical protein n=1 Tax=Pseudarthrobacter sp. MM222 TaxID=3018929 RepID=UPI00221FF4EC|nr:hypothetical protein [Pseudarthrobacter sp. MM222]
MRSEGVGEIWAPGSIVLIVVAGVFVVARLRFAVAAAAAAVVVVAGVFVVARLRFAVAAMVIIGFDRTGRFWCR